MWSSAVAYLYIEKLHPANNNTLDIEHINCVFINSVNSIICKKKKYLNFHFWGKTIKISRRDHIELVFQIAFDVGKLIGRGDICIFTHPSWYFIMIYDITDCEFRIVYQLIINLIELNKT